MANKISIGTSTLSTPVNGGIAGATARPYDLSTYNADGNLTLEVIDQKLNLESTLDDVYIGIADPVIYTGDKISVPNDFIMKLDYEQGANTAVIPITDPLTGPARIGTSEKQRGWERDSTLKSMKVYYNEYSQAMVGSKWGKNFNDLDKFNYYAGIQPKLSKYFQELTGKYYREALLETYSEPLTKTGVGLTQIWNPNWFFQNLEIGNQPSYDSTLQDFSNNLATAAAAAATGTAGVNANIDLDYLLNLEDYARKDLRINPISMGGKNKYLCILPSKQISKLRKNQAGQLGEVWVTVSAMTKEEQAYPGTVGMVGNLIIISDDRYPTIEFDTYDAGTSITTEYTEPGNDDSRNATVYDGVTNLAWDIGYLVGTNACWDWTKRGIHFETDDDEYGKIQAQGAFTERGIGLTFYDEDDADQDDSSRDNWSSIVLAFTATTLVSIA